MAALGGKLTFVGPVEGQIAGVGIFIHLAPPIKARGDYMLIPVLFVRDMSEAITFYVEVLDFELAFAAPPEVPFYAILTRGSDELHLNVITEHSSFGPASVIVLCDNVDALFGSFKARGLSVPTRANSPVHEGPLEQTWGTREVYVDDPSGNTLVFQQRQ